MEKLLLSFRQLYYTTPKHNRKHNTQDSKTENAGSAQRHASGIPYIDCDGLQALHLVQAMLADELVLIIDYMVCIAAEDAAGLILLQNNLIAVHKDFDGILRGNTHCSAQFDRNNNTAEGIELTDNTGGFHK